MSNSIVASLKEFLEGRNAEFAKSVDGLSDDAVNWRPGTDMNSIYENLMHAMDVERGNIVAITGAEATFERRPNTLGSAAAVQKRLQEAQADLNRFLHEGAEIDPDREVTMYRRQMPVSLAMALGLGHVNEHMGHVQLTRQLWDQYGTTGKLSGADASDRYRVQ